MDENPDRVLVGSERGCQPGKNRGENDKNTLYWTLNDFFKEIVHCKIIINENKSIIDHFGFIINIWEDFHNFGIKFANQVNIVYWNTRDRSWYKSLTL